MKKLSIICSALLALGLSACDDSSDLGKMQVNEQEAIMSAGGITTAFGEALDGNDLNLARYNDGTPIPVITVTEAPDLPEGDCVEFTMQLASQADYSDAVTLPVTDGTVSAEAWDNWFRDTLGKRPDARDNYVRFAAYVSKAGQLVRVGTPETWFAAKKLSVTPVALNVENEYYLIGTANGWALDNAFPMSNGGQEVFDNPVFTIVVDITEQQVADNNGWWWKVAPASGVAGQSWDNVLGPVKDGSSDLSGSITDSQAGAGVVTKAGKYLMSVNVLDMTYSFSRISYLWTPGQSNGWSQTASQRLRFDAASGTYRGVAYLDTEFKFSNQENWDGTNFGFAEEGKLSTAGDAANIPVSAPGLYWLVVNEADLTYSMTQINTLGAIGANGDWNTDVVLTPSADFLKWTGNVTFAAGDSWKVRANGGWDINWGGNTDDMEFNAGNNFPGPASAGTYAVEVDFSTLPYKVTLASPAAVRRR